MRTRAITALRPFRAARPAWRPLPHFSQRRPQSGTVRLLNGEEIKRQDVYFKTASIFSWRRFMTLCVYGLTVYYGLKYIPRLAGFEISVELDDDEEEEEIGVKPKRLEDGVELTEEDLEADEDSLFIPMTWAEKLPRTYYKGTDPEWQEFIKVSKNPERSKEIASQLLESFAQLVKTNPALVKQIGADLQRSKHWLNVTFPDGPPQQYIRSGLEIGDGYIAWSRQRVEAQAQHRLSNVMWPSALASSIAAFYSVFAKLQLQEIMQTLGFKSGNDEYGQHIKAMEAIMSKKGGSKVQSDTESISTAPTVSMNKSEPSERASKALWPLPSVTLPTSKNTEASPPGQLDLKTAVATHVFAQTLAKKLSPKKLEAPRGTFFVHGLIEMQGKNGRMLFDVIGIYDPKQEKYVGMHAGVKHFQRAKQAPKGGE